MGVNDKNKNGQNDKTKTVGVVRRTFAKILPICLFSLFISGFILSVANDMYAFVKDDREVTLWLEEPATLNEISRFLGQKKVVNNPAAFTLYVKSKNKVDTVEGFVGELTVNSKMSYREILAELS